MLETLVTGANPDGGWPYYPGHASRLEPTCWALLALLAHQSTAGSDMSAHRDFLLRSRRSDGLVLEQATGEENRPNLAFNGFLALLLLAERRLASDAFRTALLSALVANKGAQLPPSPINRQDNALQGWAWIDSTFSWVEPTSWCLLALKKAGRLPPVRATGSAPVNGCWSTDAARPAGGTTETPTCSARTCGLTFQRPHSDCWRCRIDDKNPASFEALTTWCSIACRRSQRWHWR